MEFFARKLYYIFEFVIITDLKKNPSILNRERRYFLMLTGTLYCCTFPGAQTTQMHPSLYLLPLANING